MKKSLIVLGAAAVLLISSTAFAHDHDDDHFGGNCQAKEENIRFQIDKAKEYGNTNRVKGLEQALSNVQRWCNDDDLRRDANKRILERQENLAEKQADLEEAIARGKSSSKIEKQRRKLAEAQEKLAEAQRELADIK